MPLTYTNPRTGAEFNDWPLGGSRRGYCKFHVEKHNKRGWRVGRTTTGKTKYHTYGGPACIVDGSDGRTYVLQHSGVYDAISIARSDFMNSEEGTVFKDSNPERFAELLEIIKSTPK